MNWVPLNVHSQFSILQSTASVKDLAKTAKKNCLSAIALTDFCNMHGVVDFYKAVKGEGIKPILGLEMMVAPESRQKKMRNASGVYGYPITLLAKNEEGYRNLCKITSIGFTEGFYYTPRVDKEILKKHSEGVICLSGSTRSFLCELAAKDNNEAFENELSWFLDLYQDDFYLEVQNHEMREDKLLSHEINKETWLFQKYKALIEKQQAVIAQFKKASSKFGIDCVATNDIKYIAPEDYKAQEILMNIQAGEVCEIWERDQFGNPKSKTLNPKRMVLPSHEFYFKTYDEMAQAFQGFEEALSNTLKIAEKIDFSFDFSKKFYPVFIPPSLKDQSYTDNQRQKEAADYLKKLCYEGIEKRYTEEKLLVIKEKFPEKDPLEIVHARLEHELEIIISKSLCDYLLIVHDFIAWAKSKKIPVGPGRGSGVGSIILYAIGITDIEPLRFSLFFERFINPERLSYPDIDVDICMDRRQEVIDYTMEKYGNDKVAQIITFGTMKAKMAIKDVGRVLNVPLAKVNKIAKLVPEDLNMTINKALEMDPDFKEMYETDEEAKRVIDYARQVEGGIRNTGIHAAGLIICGDPLTDHIPVCTSKDTHILATQYSMKPVETVGMLKIDFLGLKTLTSIQKAVDTIEKHSGVSIDWSNLPLDDQKTFELLNHGKTLGIFQLESAGMKDLVKQLHVDKFEEIIAVGALYRPGPMEMIPSFIGRKHGKEEIEIDHPLMADILKETNGIIVYQEQVMQIAQLLANYSLGEGDVLRRAMGKKDKEEMAKQGNKFKEGALKNNIPEETAMMIFNKVEKFASYGFNKSHATAYAYLTYVTSFLKANYTKEWMAALMTCDIDDLTKVAKHIRECQSLQITILPPDVNHSHLEFVPTDKGIHFSLAAIKGIGEGVVDAIVSERGKKGSFSSLEDFVKRMDPRKVGKKAIENLIDAGCFDFVGDSRAYLKALLEESHEVIVKQQKEKEKGFMDLFSDHEEENLSSTLSKDSIAEETRLFQLEKEKQLLGFYVTGHPLDEFKKEIEKLDCTPLDEVTNLKKNTAIKTAFVLDTVQIRLSNKTQKKFAIVIISDGIERFELPVWPDIYANNADLFEENKLLFGVFSVDVSEEIPRLSMRFVDDLSTINEESMKKCEEIFELTKKQLQSSPKKKQAVMQEKKVNKPVKISFDVSEMRLSHILDIKQIFHDYSGNYPLELIFMMDGKQLSSLHIEDTSGVAYTEEFESTLKNLPYCHDVTLTK